MKIHLFQELLALNQEFDHVIRGLERMEKMPTYRKEMIRWARAHEQNAQVEASRQSFDEFDAIAEKDAMGAYQFLRDYEKGTTAADEIYLEIKDREEAGRAKGLPPRLVILPNWDFNDEQRYESEQPEKRKRAANKRRRKTKRRARKFAKPSQQQRRDSQPEALPTQEEGNHQ